jgi:(R,R)-butanediol dehydrogenase/meso-butanediol dehydrogenase/diacetyl reductase
MKAAVFNGIGEGLAIVDLGRPEPGLGEVVIRVEACGVCGSDLHATDAGVFLQEAGTVLGHEFSGEIVASSDPALPSGTRATAIPVNPCGRCLNCREGFPMLCADNLITGLAGKAVPGAYAEFVRVPARYVVPLPDGVSYEEGAMVEPLAVGLHAVNTSGLSVGDRVLIIGAGPIGLSVTAFAKIAGAGTVVVSERAPARLRAASDFGADAVIDAAATPDVGAEFARIAGGMPDVVFDCVGVPGMIQTAITLSRPRGTIVVVGVCMKEDTQIPLTAILKELRIQYILGYEEADFGRVLQFMQQGRVKPAPMVTDRVSLAALPAAFEALRQPGSQIKLMILPQR